MRRLRRRRRGSRERVKFPIYASAVGQNPRRRAIGNGDWENKRGGTG